MSMKYLIIMSLLLSGCGMVNKAQTTLTDDFHLHGKELMETTYCIWEEPTLSASLVMHEYSDGSVDKSAVMSMTGLQDYTTTNINDFEQILYVYYDSMGVLRQSSLIGNDTVCQHQFYNYQ